MGELVDSAIAELAEQLSEGMGLSIPAPEILKVAGAMLATETVKSALDFLVPSASSAMSFSTTGWVRNRDNYLVFRVSIKENKYAGQCAQSKRRLLQLQIQGLQVTECSYKNSSIKFIMATPLKWCMLRLCTLTFQYDIQNNALKN